MGKLVPSGAIRTLGDVFVPPFASNCYYWSLYGDSWGYRSGSSLSFVWNYCRTFKATNFYTYSVVLTGTAFPSSALICWSAFRVFGGNPLLGLVLGLMMVTHPYLNCLGCGLWCSANPLLWFYQSCRLSKLQLYQPSSLV